MIVKFNGKHTRQKFHYLSRKKAIDYRIAMQARRLGKTETTANFIWLLQFARLQGFKYYYDYLKGLHWL